MVAPEHPWNEPLFEALKARAERFPHALLLHGARGNGKLGLAGRTAQFLLCEDPARRPCGRCEGCRWFGAGTHPDFRRVEPEALATQPAMEPEEGAEPAAKRGKPSIQIKIEQVRALDDFLNLGSHRGRLRVALIHPAEDMNLNTSNALLKSLEEPPPGAVFLLVSHRPSQLLPTIRSRCVALAVPIPPRPVALQWLAGQGVERPERWLAYAGGSPLLALDYAARGEILERLLQRPSPIDDRDDLDAFAEALQKIAVDCALTGLGLPAKYQAASIPPDSARARAWLRFARQVTQHREFTRHPLNPKLFSAQMLAEMPAK